MKHLIFDLCYWTKQKVIKVWFVDLINNVTNYRYLGTRCVLELSTEKGSDIG